LINEKIILQNSQNLVTNETETKLGIWSSIWEYGWKPTTVDLLRDTEAIILKRGVKTPFEQFFVDVGGHHINTIKLGSGPPMVMLHGFGGGVGIWVPNLDALAQHYTIYALDILGFGRSSRPTFSGVNAEASEAWFLEGLELWVGVMKIHPFVILGHSFGAYLAAIYTLKYPHQITRLILADPWGVPERPDDTPPPKGLRGKAFTFAASVITSPFSILRAVGPIGPSLVDRFRPDLSDKFSLYFEDPQIVSSYIYHCNAQDPSGESAFWYLQIPFGWAKLPLEKRLDQIPETVPITAIYGEDTWMKYKTFYDMLLNLQTRTEMLLLPHAGHHVYVDAADLFNKAVIATKQDAVPRFIATNKLQGWYNYDK